MKKSTFSLVLCVVLSLFCAKANAQALNGTYTIGASSSTNYKTFAQAVSSLSSNGISGAVVFNVEAGTYSEQVKLGSVNGVSETNTITFQSASGDKDVTITSSSYSDMYGTVTVMGADYVTFRNMNITSGSNAAPAVYIKGKSDYVSLIALNITAQTTTGWSDKTYGVFVYGENEGQSNNDYFTMDSCNVNGGRIGANISGTGYVSQVKQKGARILNSTFDGQHAKAIYMQKEADFVIAGNTVINTTSTTNDFWAIDFVAMRGAVVKNNKIQLNVPTRAAGLYFREREQQDSLAAPTLIYNNEIVFTALGGSSHGIISADDLVNTHVEYNTVLMNSTSAMTNSSAMQVELDSRYPSRMSTIKHNIFQNMVGGYALYVNQQSDISSGDITFANNNYYTSGTILGEIGGVELNTLQDLCNVTRETNSTNIQANFSSNTNLLLTDTTGLISAATEEFAATDITGKARGAKSVPGAYSFGEAVDNEPILMADGYPSFCNIKHSMATMNVRINANGKLFYAVQSDTTAAPSKENVLAANEKEMDADSTYAEILISLVPASTYKVYYVLTNADGSVSSDVVVSDEFSTSALPSGIADFENLTLAVESHVPGNYTAEEEVMTEFYSGDYKFKTYSFAEWATWAFFSYTNETDTSFVDYNVGQFRNVVGAGVEGSANYSVVYVSTMMGITSLFTNDLLPKVIDGMYITNTPVVRDAVVKGDATETAFVTGDSLILQITGVVADAVVSSISYPLADYRNSDVAEHYLLSTWEWFDLSALGAVDEVRFNIVGSRNGSFGLNSPAYFAIDNFGASCPIRDVESQDIGENGLDLSTLVKFTDKNNITYEVIKKDANINVAIINGYVLKVSMAENSGSIVILATQHGKKDYIRIPLSKIITSINNNDEDLTNVWTNNGTINIECSADEYQVEIFTVSGICLAKKIGLAGLNSIYVGKDNKVLIVRISSATSSKTERVIIK